MAGPLYIFWDESQIWGLLLSHALRRLGVRARLVRASEIASGLLRENAPSALLIPGGFASHKAKALGETGQKAVRAYVASGGNYLGFCGGAGLALSGGEGLGLCPLGRKGFGDRLQHFASGHINASLASSGLVPAELGQAALLPVWWPGRFDPAPAAGVEVLASYLKPGADFMMADIELGSLPADTLSDWQNLYGVSLAPDFLHGAPCVVSGGYGKGSYVLSYAHLETPGSAEANLWLAHLLRSFGTENGNPDSAGIASYSLRDLPLSWPDPTLLLARELLDEILELGIGHYLLYWRNPWLMGWRMGLPGAQLNSLYALVRQALASAPGREAQILWRATRDEFKAKLILFHKALTGYFLAERLALTLRSVDPGAIPAKALKEERAALFGHPPAGRGLCSSLVGALEELLLITLNQPDQDGFPA